MTAAQDPDEPFDLYGADGRPLGRAKPRALVHRDGDWHRSLHLWVVTRATGAPLVLFQRRSSGKDTWPGALDVAVTGHLRAGESVAEALREAREELGLDVAPGEVVRLGLRRRQERGWPGVIDREHQDILLAVVDAPLAALRPSPDELDGVVALPLAAATALCEGRVARAPATLVRDGREAATTIAACELVPAPDDYYARALASVAAVLAGQRPAPWRLG